MSQFRQLCEIADRDRSLTDTLKKVLKLSKGWETAREHVYKAVSTDNRMRCDLLHPCWSTAGPCGIIHAGRCGSQAPAWQLIER